MAHSNPTATQPPILTAAMRQEIEQFFERYPTRQAVTLPALHVVNKHLRHVPLQAVVEIAEMLKLSPAQVQDTLSFYGFFPQQAPHGKTRAWVCRSISCALRGGEEILAHMCARAGVQPGGTTKNGQLTLEYGECLGACEMAPCMLAGEELVGQLTVESSEKFLAWCGALSKP